MAKLSVEIVTGERVVFTENDVDMVVAPGTDGMLGILPKHAPLITTLTHGELRVKKDGTEQSLVVFGGFMEVTPTKVIILADTAERAEEIDLARADAARRQAEADLASRQSTVDLAEAQAALRRASLRLNIARRRGPRSGGMVGGPGEGL